MSLRVKKAFTKLLQQEFMETNFYSENIVEGTHSFKGQYAM